MKRYCMILCCALLLSGCGAKSQAPETLAPTASVESQAVTEASTAPATQATEFLPDPTQETVALSHAAYQVVYSYMMEDTEEYCTFQGIGPDGSLVWTRETAHFPASETPRINPIGRFEGTYYYNEDGTVVALDVITGDILWQNPEFKGSTSAALIDEDYGYLYLCGSDSPDFMAIDPQGNTVRRIDVLSTDHSGPIRIQQAGQQLLIYLSKGPDGAQEEFPVTVDMDWIPQAQG